MQSTEPASSSLTDALGQRPTLLSLSDLVSELRMHSSNSDEHRIAAAFLLQQVRDRIIAGELGADIKWREWMRLKIRISDSQRAVLLAVADADDPKAELKRQYGLKAARQRKYFANVCVPAHERNPSRLEAIKWIRQATDENVARVLRHIKAIEETREVRKCAA